MGSFGYISNIALFFYIFMLLMLLAAKKNRVANSFIVLLVAMICWTGGSAMMRGMRWPGYQIWYHVSLFGLLLIPLGYYNLITEFAGKSNTKGKWIYFIGFAVCFLANVPGGFLLAPPEIVEVGKKIQFIYHIDWHISFLILVILAVMVHLGYTFYQCWHGNETMQKQFKPVLWGFFVLCLGQLLVLAPIFAGFPIDIISGVINALIVLYALTKCQIIQLELLRSESVCYEMGLLLGYIWHLLFQAHISEQFTKMIPLPEKYLSTYVLTSFLLTTIVFVLIWKFLVQHFFIRKEKQRTELIREFNRKVSRTLRVKEIAAELLDLAKNVTDHKIIYVFELDPEAVYFKAKYSSIETEERILKLQADHRLVHYLRNVGEGVLLQDFYQSDVAAGMKESDRILLENSNIEGAVGLWNKEHMNAILLIRGDGEGKPLDKDTLQLITSACSVASLAHTKAALYEQAYQEARTDELTGLLNRKSFQEILNEEYAKEKDRQMAFVLINIDDFKLYNQLYGTRQGDLALQQTAEIIKKHVGEKGYVARYTGKEFAILLPKYDVYEATRLTKAICTEIHSMNQDADSVKLKALTVSAGISTTPYASKNVQELLNNADLAVYHVKHRGKNGIQAYDTIDNPETESNAVSQHQQNVYQEYQATIYALTAAIDAKDHYTFSHSQNVAYYATELAKAMNLNVDEVEMTRQAALLHDVGKISIAESILDKPGQLTAEEYEVIKGHVEASINIIRHLPSLDYVIPAVIGHHERYDGKGYPRRIEGEDIPLTARILCLADSFDAMTSVRVYKKAMPLERALDVLQEEAGKQFDPELVKVFIACIQEEKIHLVG